MSINTATATYKQYETCDHRTGTVVMGVQRDHYDTPCPTCAANAASTKLGAKVVSLMVLLAFLTYLVA